MLLVWEPSSGRTVYRDQNQVANRLQFLGQTTRERCLTARRQSPHLRSVAITFQQQAPRDAKRPVSLECKAKCINGTCVLSMVAFLQLISRGRVVLRRSQRKEAFKLIFTLHRYQLCYPVAFRDAGSGHRFAHRCRKDPTPTVLQPCVAYLFRLGLGLRLWLRLRLRL